MYLKSCKEIREQKKVNNWNFIVSKWCFLFNRNQHKILITEFKLQSQVRITSSIDVRCYALNHLIKLGKNPFIFFAKNKLWINKNRNSSQEIISTHGTSVKQTTEPTHQFPSSPPSCHRRSLCSLNNFHENMLINIHENIIINIQLIRSIHHWN